MDGNWSPGISGLMSMATAAARPWLHTPIHDNTAERVLSACGITAQSSLSSIRVLDFGCGNGRYLEVFARRLPLENVVGVDVDDNSLEQARSAGFNVIRLDENIVQLPFETGQFDVVFSSNVIEHIPKDKYYLYLKEIARVMRPRGILALGAPNYPYKRAFDILAAFRNRELFTYYLFDDPTHCNRVRVLDVERDLEPYFTDIKLMPSELPFQRWFSVLQREDMQYRLRRFGNKFFGTARRRADPS